mgnify:CR=1 FL=1
MRKLASIQEIAELAPIPGADSIEAARVNGWWSVVRKGEFSVGQRVVFFEIDSLLPVGTFFDFLMKNGKTKKMVTEDGIQHEGILLRTIRLKGQLSQGLIMPIDKVTDEDLEIGDDMTEFLGVYKYEKPIPASLASQVKGNFPWFIPKTDEERVQNIDPSFVVGKSVYVTEKMDGTSCTIYKRDGEIGVCSRNLELKQPEGDSKNAYWQVAQEIEAQRSIPQDFAIQGEIIGPGIQGNPYLLDKPQFVAFNVYDIKNSRYLDYDAFVLFCSDRSIRTVPVTDDFTPTEDWTTEKWLEYAQGFSTYNDKTEREGVVVRCQSEDAVSMLPTGLTRPSFKAISNRFLLGNKE